MSLIADLAENKLVVAVVAAVLAFCFAVIVELYKRHSARESLRKQEIMDARLQLYTALVEFAQTIDLAMRQKTAVSAFEYLYQNKTEAERRAGEEMFASVIASGSADDLTTFKTFLQKGSVGNPVLETAKSTGELLVALPDKAKAIVEHLTKKRTLADSTFYAAAEAFYTWHKQDLYRKMSGGTIELKDITQYADRKDKVKAALDKFIPRSRRLTL